MATSKSNKATAKKKPAPAAKKPASKPAASRPAAKPAAKPVKPVSKLGPAKPGVSSLDRLSSRAASKSVTSNFEVMIPLSKLRFDEHQPRTSLHALDGRIRDEDQLALEELAASIKAQDLIEAITVREIGDGNYMVVVGERRTRAHILNGATEIRAVVRNDEALKHPLKRLLFQVAENVNRKDLSDLEMSNTIMRLLNGDPDNGIEPIDQVQVAEHLGKSEGWVTRFVKFADAELRRVWYDSGIADTVEKVYRLSILPAPVRAEIVRRAQLPEGDPDKLEIPLNRGMIDSLARQAKEQKRATVATSPAATTPATSPAAAFPGKQTASVPAWPFPTSPAVKSQSEEQSGGENNAETGTEGAGAGVGAGKGYNLDDAARNAILSKKPAEEPAASSSRTVTAPIVCAINAGNVAALIEHLESTMDEMDDFDSALRVRCELNIPGELAAKLANHLAGHIVSESEIPATLQNMLAEKDWLNRHK